MFKTRIADLTAKIAKLKAQGEILRGVWLDYWEAPSSKKYHRLRRYGKRTLLSGCKTQYVPLNRVDAVRAAIERGKRLTALEKELAAVIAERDSWADIIAQVDIIRGSVMTQAGQFAADELSRLLKMASRHSVPF